MRGIRRKCEGSSVWPVEAGKEITRCWDRPLALVGVQGCVGGVVDSLGFGTVALKLKAMTVALREQLSYTSWGIYTGMPRRYLGISSAHDRAACRGASVGALPCAPRLGEGH